MAAPMHGFYAHTKPGCGPEHWQPLEKHLHNVAQTAAEFANAFGAADWGRVAGLWHDVGKFSQAFQEYLRTVCSADPHVADTARRTDHSTGGAQHAVATFPILGHLLAYAIGGHHSGLQNGRDVGACLDVRLRKTVEPWQHGLQRFPAIHSLQPPPLLQTALSARDGAFATSFFLRMLFSCLVDADFLDTEAFMNPERAGFRAEWPRDVLPRMEQALTGYIATFGAPATSMACERAAVREACLEAAAQEPGLFSLTVPTGGGKTLASLAFALRHARNHGLDRVVYVIPFTSIIEQNADVFRDALRSVSDSVGRDIVIEHHSSLDPDTETTPSRLATENWDAPLVVTTSVQFYESLFACRSSRCRKLHNVARSVVILDEVQTLPVDFLKPCLRALQELVQHYGTTVLLCTATQPAVHHRQDFTIGLRNVREIIPEPARLYDRLRRVHVEDMGPLADEDLTARLREHAQVLCIVNTRRHARALYEGLREVGDTVHLSALMCPAHRAAVLTAIRQRLADRRPCRVVSTQLIEAGVDVDFPVVFRSLAGLDSIAQAAGRCNRNGTLPDGGRTFVFRSEHTSAERYFADTASCAEQVLALHDDPLGLDTVEHYFKLYYWDQQARWDAKLIMGNFHLYNDREFPFGLNFATAARDFRLIENTQKPVIVPWGKQGFGLCERLRRESVPSRNLLRQLQRYTVQIPEREWNQHIGREIELLHEQFPVLICGEMHYSEETGLLLERADDTFLSV